MAFCGKCGTQLDDGVLFCPNCGAPVQRPEQGQPFGQQGNQPFGQQPNGQSNGFADFVKNLNNTPDTTAEYDPADIADTKAMSVLAYLGLLVLVPVFAAPKSSKFARFHANQGLALLLVDVAYSILSFLLNLIQVTRYEEVFGYSVPVGTGTPWIISLLLFLVGLPILALTILGIVNAASGKAKELPFIGKIRLLK